MLNLYQLMNTHELAVGVHVALMILAPSGDPDFWASELKHERRILST